MLPLLLILLRMPNQASHIRLTSCLSRSAVLLNGLHHCSSPPPEPPEPPIRTYADLLRFLRSLSIKAHAAPLTIDAIADLFQDFYLQAESHISTHIATLSTRIARENSPAPATSVKNAIKGRKRGNSAAGQSNPADSSGPEQQMLTPSEVADRRKARRMLELKRAALEEAVERGLCEKVYDKIYRHRSADDEERDAKLRSRTAALALVGIGLKELHVNIGPDKDSSEAESGQQQQKINDLLSPARESLRSMDDEHYPLGKLQKLTEAHKNIVETLSHLFPSSSSADEVLPTLIYTLITSDPETLNVISNLHFIQLFRSRNKVDGEAAYCLVNLEAAISFLETVDLSSLRADEAPEGPPKATSRPQSPVKDQLAPLAQEPSPRSVSPGLTPASATSQDLTPSDGLKTAAASNTFPRPSAPNRRLSSLIQAQAERIEEGRVELLNSADQAFDAINSTLENSFKFLFGRLKEQQARGQDSPVMLPKTLEDARKLVSSPTLLPSSLMNEDEVTIISGRSSIHESPLAESPDDPLGAKDREKPEKDMLSIVGGRLRDLSVDSSKSAGSGNGRRVGFNQTPLSSSSSPPGTAASAADQVGNLMNSLNPLKGFGVPSFGRAFGRSASLANTPGAVAHSVERSKQLGEAQAGPEKAGERKEQNGKADVKEEVDLGALETLAQLRKTKPPVKRFMDIKSANDLRIGEVEALLKDYRRLAEALREAISS